VIGEDITDEVNTIRLIITFEPALQGVLTTALMVKKATLFRVKLQAASIEGIPIRKVTEYDYNPSHATIYPFEVGKEPLVSRTEKTNVTTAGQTETEIVTHLFTYKVEGLEEVTVPAGTFMCYRIVKYDESGNKVNASWHSDEVKNVAKSLKHEFGETSELLSYSLAD
jgi:hypothetical protein